MINPPLILASNSARRQQILKEAGFDFTVNAKPINEDYYNSYLRGKQLTPPQIVCYLAELKANTLKNEITNEIVIAADTIVYIPAHQRNSKNISNGNVEIFGKPRNQTEAFKMLRKLSGKKHLVITGVCLLSKKKYKSFYDKTEVYFRKLKYAEINYYIKKFMPYDKAGAYGIQEWIGMIGIEKIVGSYFNVMGLPVHKVYKKLKDCFEIDITKLHV